MGKQNDQDDLEGLAQQPSSEDKPDGSPGRKRNKYER
jgi:hypothetical protein